METNAIKKAAEEIPELIRKWESRLLSLDEEVISARKNTQNRTIRQITGHMVDSASNNTHRVVHLQYQPSPLVFPNYATEGNNDRWIAIQNYQKEPWGDLVQLWKYSMLHFCHVIQHVQEEKLNNEWIAAAGKNITLKEMILDFNRHLKLHLDEIEQLIPDEPGQTRRITDGVVTLRPFRPEDREKLSELANNEKIAVNLRDGFPHPYTLADADKFIKMAMAKPDQIFAIEYEGDYVGNIGVHVKSDVYRLGAEIGYFLGEPYWGKGIMTKAVKLVCDYAFLELGIHRIDTGVFDFNPPSMRVLEKCGFVREAVFRKSVVKRGKVCDEVRYALLKEK